MRRRWSTWSVWAGAGWWFVVVAWRVPNAWHGAWASALLVFATLVLVPLAWPLFGAGDETGTLRWGRRAQWGAAVLLSFAVWWPRGAGALALALPWIAVTVLLASDGLAQVWRARRKAGTWNIGRAAAQVFVAIGGAWLAADRVGWRPLGFSEDIVLLTAVHFHYAGLVLPLVAGEARSARRESRLAGASEWGVVTGVPLVAIGITTAQLGVAPGVEMLAAAGLGVSGLLVAAVHAGMVREPQWPGCARAAWAVASAALAFGMTLAMIYGARDFVRPWPWLDLPWMRALHGTANALGFSLCALLGWRWARGRETFRSK